MWCQWHSCIRQYELWDDSVGRNFVLMHSTTSFLTKPVSNFVTFIVQLPKLINHFFKKENQPALLLIIWTLGVLKLHYDSVNRFIINLWEACLNDRLNSDRPTPLLLGGNFLLFAADAHCCFVPTRPDKRWIAHLPLTNIFLKASRFSGKLHCFLTLTPDHPQS